MSSPLPKPCFVGFDVGGSAVKLGALTRGAERLFEDSVPIEAGEPMDGVFDRVADALRDFLTEYRIGGIGVGVPGLLDRYEGRVEKSPNIHPLEGFAIADALAARLDVEPWNVRIENDANVAALGELWLGAARGASNVLLMTLGSGIGGGLILNTQLYIGDGLAGEVGHITIEPDGPACGCGSRGCLETLASANAARRRAVERSLPADDPGNLERLTEIARAGAGPERDLLEEIGRDLGHGVANIVCALDVRTFVFGGGFAAALDVLEPGIRRGLLEWAYGERVSAVKLLRASLGASAGWIGAARLAMPA